MAADDLAPAVPSADDIMRNGGCFSILWKWITSNLWRIDVNYKQPVMLQATRDVNYKQPVMYLC